MEKEFLIIDYSDSEVDTVSDDASVNTIESDIESTKNKDDNVDTGKVGSTKEIIQYKCEKIGCKREFSTKSMFQHHQNVGDHLGDRMPVQERHLNHQKDNHHHGLRPASLF